MRTWLLSLAIAGACVARAAEPATVMLDVRGMYCSLCSLSVRKVLERVPGVLEAQADSSAKRASVKYDPDRVAPEEIAAALAKNGFPASVRRP